MKFHEKAWTPKAKRDTTLQKDNEPPQKKVDTAAAALAAAAVAAAKTTQHDAMINAAGSKRNETKRNRPSRAIARQAISIHGEENVFGSDTRRRRASLRVCQLW